MIELINLNKSYKQNLKTIPVLENINLHVEKGEIFGIIGKSGAGKSTLLRCINHLEIPTSGEIVVNGHYLYRLATVDLRLALKDIGTVFQQYQLFSARTAAENISFPLELIGMPKAEQQKIVTQMLALVELSEYGDRYPAQLSGGQKQRIAIARALACNPKILLFDEATAALDPQTTAAILALLKKINAELNVTILLITHEMEVIKSTCHKVALLDQGRIIEQGDVYEFFTCPTAPLAKQLTQNCLIHPLPRALLDSLQKQQKATTDHPMLKLFFYGKAAHQPLVFQLITQYGVEVNILQANIEFIKHLPIGIMVVVIMGHEEKLAEAIHYLKNQDVHVEVIGYVRGDIRITY